MNTTENVLKRVDKYLSFMRYKYTMEEKLSRLETLQNYYETLNKSHTVEHFKSNIEIAEHLSSGNLKIPLKVRGIFLREGRPSKKFYTVEELKKSVANPVNREFPLMLDHEDDKAGKVIGLVTKIWFDGKIKALRWKGHINDETFARNVVDRAIKDVSATVYSIGEIDDMLGLVGKDLTYKELSLVMSGSVTGNIIEPDI